MRKLSDNYTVAVFCAIVYVWKAVNFEYNNEIALPFLV